jgi:carbonic anhydrase
MIHRLESSPMRIMRTHSKKTQSEVTPEEALVYLQEGNHRFVSNLRANRNLLQQVNETSDGQFPFAIILSCIDSRTSAELIFDQGLGDIFSVRVAGNVVNEDVLGSMEYACKVAGSKLVVVLGHSKCGAVTSACQHAEIGNITALLRKIQPAVLEVEAEVGSIVTEENIQRVADVNVDIAINEIREKSDILKEMEQEGSIKIVGAMYDVDTGLVSFH